MGSRREGKEKKKGRKGEEKGKERRREREGKEKKKGRKGEEKEKKRGKGGRKERKKMERKDQKERKKMERKDQKERRKGKSKGKTKEDERPLTDKKYSTHTQTLKIMLEFFSTLSCVCCRCRYETATIGRDSKAGASCGRGRVFMHTVQLTTDKFAAVAGILSGSIVHFR